MASTERSITHYRSSHKILLVGEGDFSFSTCIAKAFGSARNITATSLDSNGKPMMKYRQARENLKRPEELGCTILHEVDALSMNHHPALEYRKFDRIIFNFPHAGFYFHEHHRLQIQLHRDVVRGFFRSARQMVTWNGQVHVTYKTTQPFSLWNIESLAEESGLRLLSKAKFSKSDKPSYDNKRGDVGRELTAVFRLGSVTLSCSPSTGVPDTNLEVTQLVFGSC
uniref:25S rRNA (uridine-N(3))-methyltransferase BMT5-like domain-containing protein n=1 Tax=Kalanchoe fedtschenkoi TaxID=63787 RepID=A0A7N0TY47_KALFE